MRIHKDCGGKVQIHPASEATKHIYYYCPKCGIIIRENEEEEVKP